jgi:hypothetical protein
MSLVSTHNQLQSEHSSDSHNTETLTNDLPSFNQEKFC